MMKKYCVLYAYDYYDNGGYGWMFFEDSQDALSFIEDRMKDNPKAKLDDFKLWNGDFLSLKAVDVVTKIMVGKS